MEEKARGTARHPTVLDGPTPELEPARNVSSAKDGQPCSRGLDFINTCWNVDTGGVGPGLSHLLSESGNNAH